MEDEKIEAKVLRHEATIRELEAKLREAGIPSEREYKLRDQLLEWKKLLGVDGEAYPDQVFVAMSDFGRKAALKGSNAMKERGGAAGPQIRQLTEEKAALTQQVAALIRYQEENEERERKRFEAEGLEPNMKPDVWARATLDRARHLFKSVEVDTASFVVLTLALELAASVDGERQDLADHNEMAADELEKLRDQVTDLEKERNEALFHIARTTLREARKPRRVVSLHSAPDETATDETPPPELPRVKIETPTPQDIEERRFRMSFTTAPAGAPMAAAVCPHHHEIEPCKVCRDIPF